jgi:hypothetical protein
MGFAENLLTAPTLLTGGYAPLADGRFGPVLSRVASGSEGFGAGALAVDTSGTATACGQNALASNTTGYQNTAVGQNALQSNSTGSQNAAVGQNALQSNSTGGDNTAVGQNALGSNVTGGDNTAVGQNALAANLTGYNNTAIGQGALFRSATGTWNTATGVQAGYTASAGNATTTASGQTLTGYNSGQGTTTQVDYISVYGYEALADNPGGTAIGTDHTGAGAHANAQDEIALGTALHQVRIFNNTTGSGSAALGANCPAVTDSAPYTWFKMTAGDGSTVYVPAWK